MCRKRRGETENKTVEKRLRPVYLGEGRFSVLREVGTGSDDLEQRGKSPSNRRENWVSLLEPRGEIVVWDHVSQRGTHLRGASIGRGIFDGVSLGWNIGTASLGGCRKEMDSQSKPTLVLKQMKIGQFRGGTPHKKGRRSYREKPGAQATSRGRRRRGSCHWPMAVRRGEQVGIKRETDHRFGG